MENKNGYGIFYGVIGVATLVVAIIGATFAYFSASVTDNTNLAAGSTTLNLEIIDQVTTGLKNDLIPVLTTGDNLTLFPHYPGINTTDCKDDSNNSICSVYQFTIANPNETTAQTVYAYLDVKQNGFQNLKFAIFRGTAAEVGENYNVNGTASATESATGVTANPGTLVHAAAVLPNVAENAPDYAGTETGEVSTGTKAVVTLPLLQEELEGKGTGAERATGSSTTYTIVVWLEEAGAANNEEQGKTFSANIRFNTGTTEGVTGSLSAAS